MAQTRPWFTRSCMNPQLEKQVFTKGRIKYHNEDGEDLRLKEPGVDWSLITSRRHDIFDDFSKQLQGLFDTFYEKIKNKSNNRKSFTPLLPTAKTPAHSKIRSRVPQNNPSPEIISESAAPVVEDQESSTTAEPVKKPAAKRGRKRKQVLEPEPQEEQPRRLTRLQAKKAPPPSTRTTRSQRAAVRETDSVLAVKSSLVGIDSEEVIEIQSNDLSRRLSSMSNSRASICQVSLEKISLQEPNPPQTQTETDTQDNQADSKSNKDNQLMPESIVNEPQAGGSPGIITEPEAEVALSVAKPTPPRRKGLKRKKGLVKTRAAELREQETAVQEIPAHSQLPSTPPAVPSSQSAESVYESCVSEVELSPPAAQRKRVDPVLVNPLPSFDEENDASTPETLVETPITVIKRTPGVASQTPDLGATPFLEDDAETPVGPAPCLSQSYLSGTPGNLAKLKEKFYSRNGGKVMSFSELLSSGGRPTPTTKKTPKPSTPKTNSKATPIVKTPLTKTIDSTVFKATAQVDQLPVIQDVEVVSTETMVEDSSPLLADKATPLLAGKRLRSVSVEKLTDFPPSKSPKTSALFSSDSSQEDNYDSPNTAEDDTDSCSESPALGAKKLTRYPKTFLRKKALAGNREQAAQPLSYLPRKSPKKTETIQEKKAQLADKMLRKREEQAKRQANLKNKRQLELQERIKKREEKARKVAENQAALKLQEEEKKKKLKGRHSGDLSKKATIKKANEIKEKNKKLNERMQAAEARRKQDALQQEKRHQQIEEERRMAVELAAKRKEQEEEERRLKRQEKLKQRQQKPTEEAPKSDPRPPPEPAHKTPAETSSTVNKHEQLRNKLEKVIGGAIAKVPVVPTPKVTRLVTNIGVGLDKTNKLLQAYWSGNQTSAFEKEGPASQTTPLSPADSRLNSTFTKATPLASKIPVSYQMTPDDPITSYENYDIDDLSSEDSTDDEDEPKKVLPMWARPESLRVMMVSQEDAMVHNQLDLNQIFPPHQLLKDPDLSKIFRRKKPRFYKRTSSAQWNSPIIKKNRLF